MLANHLMSGEMAVMLDLIHSSTACNSMHGFKKLAHGLENLLGNDKTTFCWKSLGGQQLRQPPKVLNVSFPEQFLQVLQRRRLWKENPITIRGMQQSGLQSWQETFRQMRPSSQLLDIKYSFGLESGYSYAIAGRQPQGMTMVSLASRTVAEVERWQLILDHLMPHFQAVLGRILQISGTGQPPPELTKREIEVLDWLKEGKTSWEISVILDVSERTINYHVGNVKKKLNVVNRQGAVAQAMHLGIVQ